MGATRSKARSKGGVQGGPSFKGGLLTDWRGTKERVEKTSKPLLGEKKRNTLK